MIFLYSSLVLSIVGICLWISGAILYKKSNFSDRKKQKKWRRHAVNLGTIGKIILVVASLIFVMGIMMLQGVKVTSQ